MLSLRLYYNPTLINKFSSISNIGYQYLCFSLRSDWQGADVVPKDYHFAHAAHWGHRGYYYAIRSGEYCYYDYSM